MLRQLRTPRGQKIANTILLLGVSILVMPILLTWLDVEHTGLWLLPTIWAVGAVIIWFPWRSRT